MKTRFFSIIAVIFLCFSLSGCLGSSVNLNQPLSETQVDAVAQKLLKASVRTVMITYYEPDIKPGNEQDGLISLYVGSGYIYGAEHWLFTVNHVINGSKSKIIYLAQKTPDGFFVDNVEWKFKKSRYFLARNCADANSVKESIENYLKKAMHASTNFFGITAGGPVPLNCFNEADFDNFVLEPGENPGSVFEFYVTPDTYRGDEKADSACVRLAHLDGKLDYVNMSDHAVGEKLRLGQTVYVWGAPYVFIEQLYKGVIANSNIKTLKVFEDRFDMNNFALADAPLAPGSSGSMLFYINDRGEGKIIGLASFVFPPPPFSCGNAFVRIDPFLQSLGFLKKP